MLTINSYKILKKQISEKSQSEKINKIIIIESSQIVFFIGKMGKNYGLVLEFLYRLSFKNYF